MDLQISLEPTRTRNISMPLIGRLANEFHLYGLVGQVTLFDVNNLGAQGIGLPRKGRNDLWINGGQIYAAPLR